MTAPDAAPPSARHFIATAILFSLSFGALLGAALLGTMTLGYPFLAGLSPLAARSAHAHAQVFGFAALFVMGVAYHAVPRLAAAPLAAPRLARASYWLQTGGVLAVALGAFSGGPLPLAGGAALVGAAACFARVIDRTLAAGTPSPQRIEPWLRAGCAWLIVAAALALAVAAGQDALRAALWDAALFGFVASWILGFSLRMLPAFFAAAPAAGGRGTLCAAYQIAVAAAVLSSALAAWQWAPDALRAAANAALVAAGGLAVWRLGVFAPPAPGQRRAPGFAPFVFAAYTWWLVALGCGPGWSAVNALHGLPPPPLVTDFGRHALTLGFLTQMIIGVSTRIVPALSGKPLWRPRWALAAFGLLNAAILIRGLQLVVALGGPPAAWPWVAASGPLALGAFLAWTILLVMTLAGAQEKSLATDEHR